MLMDAKKTVGHLSGNFLRVGGRKNTDISFVGLQSHTSANKWWNDIMASCKTIMSDILEPVACVLSQQSSSGYIWAHV